MKMPYSEDEINEATLEVVRKNNLEECYIRPLAFFGYGQMGLSTLKCNVDVSIAAWPWGAYLGDKHGNMRMRVKRREKLLFDLAVSAKTVMLWLPQEGKYYRGALTEVSQNSDRELAMLVEVASRLTPINKHLLKMDVEDVNVNTPIQSKHYKIEVPDGVQVADLSIEDVMAQPDCR